MAHVDPDSALHDALDACTRPKPDSHKGQNGRLLVIGGSKLFHSAVIWAAGAASRIVDLVHFSSTTENNDVFIRIKSEFLDGIVIERRELLNYVDEDDCILIGPGFARGDVSTRIQENRKIPFNELIYLEPEHDLTYALVRYLIMNHPTKRYVFDAGALQMMNRDWLLHLETSPIITPHVNEFKKLFGTDLSEADEDEKIRTIMDTAKKYRCTIHFKNITDYITDGIHLIRVTGGNAGLSKGGSGDILAGLISAFYTKSDPITSCVLASYILKTTAEKLYDDRGEFYNSSDIVRTFGKTAYSILLSDSSRVDI